MKSEILTLADFSIAGLSVTTNNRAEMQAGQGKIAALVQRYYQQKMAERLKARTEPGVTYALYTEFVDQDRADYTYLIGEKVETGLPQNAASVRSLSLEPSHYQRFTTDAGAMPNVVIDAWQSIWSMSDSEFASRRLFKADFERYDQRAIDPKQAVIEIYLGIATE